MRGGRTILRIAGLSALALAVVLGQRVAAEEIAVGNFGVAANGMPFGVARAKGFFKQEGIDVSGIITSAGGGTSLRICSPAAFPMARSIPASSSPLSNRAPTSG
jgi:NitT/TauT family transport system substrate-binding protein